MNNLTDFEDWELRDNDTSVENCLEDFYDQLRAWAQKNSEAKMIKKCVLIIDKRVELSTKYKKLLEQMEVYTLVSNEITNAIKLLTKYEPDLIIVLLRFFGIVLF